jgi:hypothetical protein
MDKKIQNKIRKELSASDVALLGGKATMEKFGKEHYIRMVNKRWENAKALKASVYKSEIA